MNRSLVLAAIALLLALVATVGGAGCSKRNQECAALADSRAAVARSITVDVADDKQPETKAAALAELLSGASNAKTKLEGQNQTDDALRSAVGGYKNALVALIAATNDLQVAFAELAACTTKLTTLATAEAAKKKALDDLMYSTATADELRALAAALRLAPDDDDDAAAHVEKLKFKSADAQRAAEAFVLALRTNAKAIRDSEGLESKLTELENELPPKRKAFLDAKETYVQMDLAVTKACAP